MSVPENKIFTSIKDLIKDHKVLCIWGALYIVTVIVGLFYSPWESEMIDTLVASGGSLLGVSDNVAKIFLPGSYDLISFFFCFFIERGFNFIVAISGLLVLSAENIIEKLISKKFSSDMKTVEKIFVSLFSSNVLFSVTSYLFAILCPVMESLPDLSQNIFIKIIALLTLVLCVPVVVNIVLCLCSFMLSAIVSAFLSVNHIPLFINCIAVFVVALIAEFLSAKISDFIGRIIWSIIPFLRPLAALLKE